MSICVCCNNDSEPLLIKENIQYWQCVWCKTVFCDALNQEGLVGGEFEKERNEKENQFRIGRIDLLTQGFDKTMVNILDFGCGSGLLVKDLKESGYTNTDGFDAYNEEFMKIPERGKYDICMSVECFEHFSFGFYEVDAIWRALKVGAFLIVETSFVDVAIDEGIPIESFFYLNPLAGHSTLFSHWGLDVLMSTKGFIPQRHHNRHVRCYLKVSK